MAAPALWALVFAAMLAGSSGFSPLLKAPALQIHQASRPAFSIRSPKVARRRLSSTVSDVVASSATLVRPVPTATMPMPPAGAATPDTSGTDATFFDDDSVRRGDEVVVKWVAHIDGSKVASSGAGRGELFAKCAEPVLPAGVVKDQFFVSESGDVADAVHRYLPHPGGNPGVNGWFLQPTLIHMPPESGGICGRLS